MDLVYYVLCGLLQAVSSRQSAVSTQRAEGRAADQRADLCPAGQGQETKDSERPEAGSRACKAGSRPEGRAGRQSVVNRTVKDGLRH